MNILYIGHDVSDYSRRLIEALAIGACGTNSHLCHKSYSSPELARQNLEDLRRSEVDALLIDLRPIMAPPIKFPQDDQKNFAQPYAAMGVPVIVLFDPRDESQRQLAEEIVMDAPQALALEKPRVTPSVRELGEKFVPSILNLVDQWKEQRKKTGAEMASLPAALRPKLELISQGQGGSEPAL